MEPGRGESCLSGQRRGLAAPGRIRLHPRIRNPSISLQLCQPGDETEIPRVATDLHGVDTPTSLADSSLAGTHGASALRELPLGQRRGLAAPEENKVTSPDLKPFQIFTNPTTRRRKRRSRGSIPPAWCGNPNPNCWLAGVHGASARRELPLGTTSRSRRSRGG